MSKIIILLMLSNLFVYPILGMRSHIKEKYKAADLHDKGLTLQKAGNSKKAHEYFRQSALLGNTEAQCALGTFYLQESKTIVDLQKKMEHLKHAEEWFLRAADSNDFNGQCGLGVTYSEMADFTADPDAKSELIEKAEKIHKKAADHNPVSQYNLGVIYREKAALLEKTDPSQAEICLRESLEWYQKSAELGFAHAQCNLAMLYENKLAHTQDAQLRKEYLDKAIHWYVAAAKQEYQAAQLNLGALCNHILGNAPDGNEKEFWFDLAKECFQKAALNGENKACYNLALLYCARSEKATTREQRKLFFAIAVDWFKKAAALAHKEAVAYLENLEKIKCAECGYPSKLRCSACGTHYCSLECQKNDRMRHKAVCAGKKASSS